MKKMGIFDLQYFDAVDKHFQFLPVFLCRIKDAMSDIYYGKDPAHPWTVDVENWQLDSNQILEDYVKAEQSMRSVENA